MPTTNRLVAFVTTADPDRALAFYEGVLGIEFIERTSVALMFSSHGAELRIAIVDQVKPAPHTVLGWQTDDIVQAVRELAGHGVEMLRYSSMAQDEIGVWSAPGGARVVMVRGHRWQRPLAD